MYNSARAATGSTLKKIIRTICAATTASADKQHFHDTIHRHRKSTVCRECVNAFAVSTRFDTARRPLENLRERRSVANDENAASTLCTAATAAAQAIFARTGRGRLSIGSLYA
jgi:hypothetical protein